MQLKTQTDYAIRILIYLSSVRGYAAKENMSKALGIASNYLPKVIRQLRDKGWVSSATGFTGGYMLTHSPKDITLLNVMEVMEDTVKMNRCLEPDGFCSRNATATCPVHQIYSTFQDFSEQYFSHVTIQDLLNPKGVEPFLNEILADVRQVSAVKEISDVSGKQNAK